ncbi:MAG TPA: type II toxin-antitoxin system HicB family antitoxin [Thermoanaerobaculia bacterium]|nr:type II toxin-antitoxin system HicB family antitoxin [Thermoanaerobaculia bacterium]
MNDQVVIRVVQFQEGGWLVAQCLEVDIAAQGKTESDLHYQLGRLLVGRILASEMLGVEPFATLPPAPKRYWDMYTGAG